MTRVAVFGTGSWGTAFACVLADAGSEVRMWGRRQDAVDQINAGVVALKLHEDFGCTPTTIENCLR